MSPWRLQTTPEKITPEVLDFCKTLGPEDPFYVKGVIPGWAKHQQCYANVLQAINRAGGKMILGWKIWEFPNMWLEAEHHAIWQHPDGPIADITPQLEGETVLLFCLGADQTYKGQNVSSVRCALREKETMEELWALSDLLKDITLQAKLTDSGMNDPRPYQIALRMQAIYKKLGVNIDLFAT
jgi:hypothetical protein